MASVSAISPASSSAQSVGGSEVIPQAITKNLGDRSYDKRKVAALELEHFIKDLNEKGETENIKSVIRALRVDFAESTQPNRRKGALIGLAASAIALHETSVNYLESVIGPVLVMLGDEDSRVRYYACEALYNIAKVARGSILVHFNEIFQGLCNLHADVDRDVRNGAQLLDRLIKDVVTESDQFDVEHFVPLLRANIYLENPYIRQLVVGWITVLDSVPDIDMLEYLPEFLGGLFNMLADSLKDIKQQSNAALEEFLREIKEAFRNTNDAQLASSPNEGTGLGVNSPVHAISLGPMVKILVNQCESTDKAPVCRVTALNWLLEFIEIDQQFKAASNLTGGLVPHYGEMVRAVLTCISDEDQHIRVKAEQTNASLLQVYGDIEMKADIQTEVVRSLVTNLMVHLPGPVGSPGPSFNSPTRTRVAALKWISMLLMKSSNDFSDLLESLFPSLLNTLSEDDDNVVALDLRVLAKISSMNKNYFQLVLKKLLALFSENQKLLESKGTMIIRQLSVLLNGETIYRALAQLLLEEQELDFASTLVQTLNLILLTSSELFELRELVKKSLTSQPGRELFIVLYRSWCHNPVATLSLCLLAQAYELGSALVFQFAEIPVTVNFLVQIDKLVQLIESPIFIHLRLQLLEPQRHPFLLKVLYGLLMLLPQSTAFNSLRVRLQSVSTLGLLQSFPSSKFAKSFSSQEFTKELNCEQLLRQFQEVRLRYEAFTKKTSMRNILNKDEVKDYNPSSKASITSQ